MFAISISMDQDHRFKPIHLRHPTSYQADLNDLPRGQIPFDHPTQSSLLDIQYQRQLQDIHAAQVSDSVRNRLQSPEYNTPSSPSTSSVDLYLDRPSATFASHIENLPTEFQPVSPLGNDNWPSEHHLSHLLGGVRDPNDQHHHHQDMRNRVSRSQPPLSQSAPTSHDAFFDYSFPVTPTNSTAALHPSSYAGSPTRSTALSNDIDNINLDQVNDVYGTSMDSAASSSYSFGLQSPPVVSSAPSTTSVYHPSPPLKNAIPKPEPATADISDIPTEPIVQKT